MTIYTPGKLTLAKTFTWNETVWNPSMISTALWLDAADSSTVTTVSGAVSQWNDKSGNGRNATQATSALRPTVDSTGINFKATINFNGSELYLTVPRGFITNSVSAFVVYSGGNVNSRIVDQRSTGTSGTVKGWQIKNRNTVASDLSAVDDGSGNFRVLNDTNGLDGSARQIAFIFAANNNPSHYINGTAYGTLNYNGSVPTDIDNTNYNITIGGNAAGGATQDFTGLIGEVILLNSGASTDTRQRIEGYLAHKWGLTANLPSDHPYKLTGPKTPTYPTNDPDFSSVSLLLHGDGINGSTTIVDSSLSPKTVTAFGNAQISTAQSKFGGSSIAFDGTGDYLTLASDNSLRFNDQAFTIECWFYSTNITAIQVLIQRRSAVAARGMRFFLINSTLTVRFGDSEDSAWNVDIASGTLLSNTWYHLAVSRQSSFDYRCFLNGSSFGSDTAFTDLIADESSTLSIGAPLDVANQDFVGYIDDLRITKGVARYTSNFTPPTAPFPDF